jgi:hypothetical protein
MSEEQKREEKRTADRNMDKNHSARALIPSNSPQYVRLFVPMHNITGRVTCSDGDRNDVGLLGALFQERCTHEPADLVCLAAYLHR